MLRRLECYILAVLGGYLPTCVIALGEDQRQRTAVVLAATAMTIAAAGAAACANAARKRAATFVAIEEEARRQVRGGQESPEMGVCCLSNRLNMFDSAIESLTHVDSNALFRF